MASLLLLKIIQYIITDNLPLLNICIFTSYKQHWIAVTIRALIFPRVPLLDLLFLTLLRSCIGESFQTWCKNPRIMKAYAKDQYWYQTAEISIHSVHNYNIVVNKKELCIFTSSLACIFKSLSNWKFPLNKAII